MTAPTMPHGPTAQLVGTVLMAVPLLIGAFVGAPVLARELETGTYRYAWTLGVSRQRWTLARLVPLAVTLAVATGLLSLLFSWYYGPLFADGSSIPLDPALFGLRGVAYAAWTLAAFTIGALAGHYIAPLLGKNLTSPPASAWVLGGWWEKGGAAISQSRLTQLMDTLFQQAMHATLPKNVNSNDIKFYKGPAQSRVLNYLTHHGYTQWTSYQPGSRFWPFQWIEGGWLLALSVLLIAATVWLVRRRAA
jgi:hypothetical protein